MPHCAVRSGAWLFVAADSICAHRRHSARGQGYQHGTCAKPRWRGRPVRLSTPGARAPKRPRAWRCSYRSRESDPLVCGPCRGRSPARSGPVRGAGAEGRDANPSIGCHGHRAGGRHGDPASRAAGPVCRAHAGAVRRAQQANRADPCQPLSGTKHAAAGTTARDRHVAHLGMQPTPPASQVKTFWVGIARV